MTGVKSHEDLIVWQKAMELAVAVYGLTKSFPREEIYGLTSQLRRAVSSVPANIAEGHARKTTKDYSHFLSVSRGSLMEARTFLQLALRLGYLTADQVHPTRGLMDEVGKMLNAISAKLDGP